MQELIDNEDKRVVGTALVGEPVREIKRWMDRKNPSDDDVPVVQVHLQKCKTRDYKLFSWTQILQKTANERFAT